MFIVKRDQIEAFRLPMREAARDKLLAGLATDEQSTFISPDKKIIIQTNELGNSTTITYSDDVLPVAITKPSGGKYGLGYDREGRLSAVQFPTGEQLSLQFSNGQLQEVATSAAKRYHFEYYKGLPTRISYPGNKHQQFVYTEFGDVRAIIDRTGQIYEYIRTPDGQLRAIKDPLNRSVRFIYDENGLLRDLVFPDQTHQSYQYDEDEDALFVQLRDGKSFSQRYDNNLIKQISWEHGPTVRFAHNELGQPTLVDSGDYSVSFTYDDQNRLSTEQSPLGQTVFQYDKGSRVSQLTLPTGLFVSYEYDADDRVIGLQVVGQTVRYTYNAQDILAEIHYPNGLTAYQQRTHIEGLRAVRLQTERGQVVSEQRYAYDSWDRLSRYEDSTTHQNLQLTYDDECRLTGLIDLKTRQPQERFTYDAKGNLTMFNGHPVVVGEMDEIRQIGRANVYYDELGNINRLRSPKGNLLLSFARNSTLTSVEVGSETWSYQYDGIGRRMSKTNGTELWRFAWTGSQMVAEEYYSGPKATPIVREYIYLPESQVPVGFRERGQLYWMQADVRGAITHVFDQQGRLVWHGSYLAFGGVTIHTAQVRQPWRLMGQYEDEETGLYYNLARYYCPWLTTYLSLDPEWSDPETYHYSYARNDPYNRADPLGNIAPLIAAALIGAAVGGVISGVTKAVEGGSFREIAGAVAHGALSGAGAAVGGVIGLAVGGPWGAYAGMVAGTGVGGLLGSLAEQGINGDNVLTKCALNKAWSDSKEEMMFAAALGLLGKVLGPALRPLGRALGRTRMGQAGTRTLQAAVASVKKVVAKVVKAIPKGKRPSPSLYLPKEDIQRHLAKFEKEGGASIFIKSDIEPPVGKISKYKSLAPRKYVMLKSEMDDALAKYKKSGRIEDLEDALGYSRGDLAGKEKDIFIGRTKDGKFKYDMPDGNEAGANKHWEPGGKTSGGKSEAVLVGKDGMPVTIEHNGKFDNLKDFFDIEPLN